MRHAASIDDFDRDGDFVEKPGAVDDGCRLERPHFIDKAMTVRRISYASSPDTTQRVNSVLSSLSISLPATTGNDLPLGGKRDSVAAAWNPRELQLIGAGRVPSLSTVHPALPSSGLAPVAPTRQPQPQLEASEALISPKTPAPPPSAASVDNAIIHIAEKVQPGYKIPSTSPEHSGALVTPCGPQEPSGVQQASPTALGYEGKGVFDAWPGFDRAKGIHSTGIRTSISRAPPA